jgi:hypothetical protein
MKFTLILLAGFSFSTLMSQTFPSIAVENIHSKEVNLPKDLMGKKSILFLAFTSNAESMLEDWYEPIYITFLDKSGFNAFVYDLNIKVVLFFTGANKSVAKSVRRKITEDIDPEMENLLLFFEGDCSAEMEILGVNCKSDTYAVVLDEFGNVLTIETADYSEEKLERIAELVEL